MDFKTQNLKIQLESFLICFLASEDGMKCELHGPNLCGYTGHAVKTLYWFSTKLRFYS